MSRIIVFAAVVGLVASLSTGVKASSLPAIVASPSNAVPECVTPGRMMAFLQSRNSNIDQRYGLIASDYMRHGEELGLRWDLAFFQMMVETANLRYTGDVQPKQNNFAGLGATGNGERGESFPDVSSGVRAHIEHVAMYAGRVVDNPVAERTRKVQEWGVLTKWQRSIRGPMTFTHLTHKWSPGDRGYSNDIKAINDLFFSSFCNIQDPQPELLAAIRGNSSGGAADAAKSAKDLVATTIAKQKMADADKMTLGGTSIADQEPSQSFTVLNSAKADAKAADVPAADAVSSNTQTKTAALAGGALKSAAGADAQAGGKEAAQADKTTAAAAAGTGKCRVWTASYGGAKAVIIKAVSDGLTNYTVLDVNKGKEKRETDAYIAAYAKGGKQIAEFDSSRAALDKAFAMCPET